VQKKKIIFIMGSLFLIVGSAAFVGGMLVNQNVRVGAPFEGEDLRSIILPAPELPTTLPQVTGALVERHDNTIIVETKSLTVSSIVFDSPANTKTRTDPQVEVVVTGETMIYRETTQPSEPFSVENQTIPQTVEQAALDDLDSQSMITAWGRKSGDRVIAEVLMYSDMVAIKTAIFEDCEICP